MFQALRSGARGGGAATLCCTYAAPGDRVQAEVRTYVVRVEPT